MLLGEGCTIISNDTIKGEIQLTNIFNAEVHHFFSFPENCFIKTGDDYENGSINWTSPDGNFKMSKGIKDLKSYSYPRDKYGDIDYDKTDLSLIDQIIKAEFNSIIVNKSKSMDSVFFNRVCGKQKTMILAGKKNRKIILYKNICASVSGGTHAFVQLIIEYPAKDEKDYNGITAEFLNSFKNDL